MISGASFDAIALRPEDRRVVMARYDARQIGKVFILDTSQVKDGTVTLRLEPMAELRGRLFVPGLESRRRGIMLQGEVRGSLITTGAGGEFRIPVMTGIPFRISVFNWEVCL